MAHAPPAGSMPSRDFLGRVFQNVDKDRSGAISCDELGTALCNGSWSPFNPETVRMMIGMFDRDNSGTINFDEFCSLWKYVTDWQNCFRSFDRDGSGSIDANELRQALSSFGYRLQEGTIQMIQRKYDRQGKGNIFFDDFIQACVVLQNLTAAFRQHDTDMDGIVTLHYEQFIQLVLNTKV